MVMSCKCVDLLHISLLILNESDRISLFSVNVPLLYPLKHRFSGFLRRYRSGTLTENVKKLLVF